MKIVMVNSGFKGLKLEYDNNSTPTSVYLVDQYMLIWSPYTIWTQPGTFDAVYR